tara:strand:- start:973 stop:1278 length:306 start_codon:yes stop_codon:yes gene_type:complete
MKITKKQLRKVIRKSMINEFFGPKKHKPEVYHSIFLDAGYTERNVRSAIPNLAKSLSDKRVDPSEVMLAVKKLMQSPKDHIAGIPGGRAIYKELRRMGVVK